MNPEAALALLSVLLKTLAAAPASGSFLTPSIDSILKSAASFIDAGTQGYAALQQLTDQIKVMVSAGRDPTDAEWSALKSASDLAHATIQEGTS